MTRNLDLDVILVAAAALLGDGFSFKSGEIYWVGREHNSIQVRTLAGSSRRKTVLGSASPLDLGIPGWVARHGRTVSTGDAKTDPRNTYQRGAQTEDVLAVPVIVKDVTVAVINLERLEPQVFGDSDVKTMEILAD